LKIEEVVDHSYFTHKILDEDINIKFVDLSRESSEGGTSLDDQSDRNLDDIKYLTPFSDALKNYELLKEVKSKCQSFLEVTRTVLSSHSKLQQEDIDLILRCQQNFEFSATNEDMDSSLGKIEDFLENELKHRDSLDDKAIEQLIKGGCEEFKEERQIKTSEEEKKDENQLEFVDEDEVKYAEENPNDEY